ncbi:MAG: UvrB/UvrC motif-containing protein [Clostridiales bacterium]|nr:UvrB/UvrC motif-containing protein [Clostridiales bacterium]
MKCQHCNKNEATTYIKRNINGKVTEMHLCSECAAKLGVMQEFGPESFFADSFLGNLLGAGIPAMNIISGIDRCEYCGSTFNDIVNSGKVGCSNCYSKFSDKLEPSIVKLHGNTSHIGKHLTYTQVDDEGEKAEEKQPDELTKLKNELKQAVKEQRFEDAAVLRDKIKNLSGEE